MVIGTRHLTFWVPISVVTLPKAMLYHVNPSKAMAHYLTVNKNRFFNPYNNVISQAFGSAFMLYTISLKAEWSVTYR